ncbi:hypothetical protein [Methanocalculus sp.]|uniref:hypothetical protein n=1 Tax=Methanocalculus sp. TaxID=2004547 RepID=UPI0026364837|nr:hypothetical protein [Methanocalculus sp.]MDG6249835.1 hypothetical protein [Methanocalculus sp.]
MPSIPKQCFLIISDAENSNNIDDNGTKTKEKSLLRVKIDEVFNSFGYSVIDAMSIFESGDNYCKICKLILSSAFGIAVITKDTKERSLKNIYLEIGLMIAYGKEVIIITNDRQSLASDLLGKGNLEYLDFIDMQKKLKSWLENFYKESSYYTDIAEIYFQDSDYEYSFEFYKKAIMYGDDTAIRNLKDNFGRDQLKKLKISNRLQTEINKFIDDVEAIKTGHKKIVHHRNIPSIALSLTDLPEGWFQGRTKVEGNYWEHTSTFRITRRKEGYPTIKSVIYRYNSIEGARLGYQNAKEKQQTESNTFNLYDPKIGEESYGYISRYPLALVIFRRANLLTRTEYVCDKTDPNFTEASNYAKLLDNKILSCLKTL